MKKYLTVDLDKISRIILAVVICVLPVIAISFNGLSFDVVKKFIFVLAILLVTVIWLIGRLQANRLSVPKNWLLVIMGVVSLVFLLAALFSGSIWPALLGLGYEKFSAFSFLIYFLVVFLIGILFQSKNQIFNFYLGLFVAFTATFLFQTGRFLWGVVLAAPFPLASFANTATNLVGSWNDFGLFAGLVAVLAMATHELLPPLANRLAKSWLVAVLVAALVCLTVVNFHQAWIILAGAAILTLIYSVSFHDRLKSGTSKALVKTPIWRPSLVVFIIALAFIILAGDGSNLAGGINQLNQKAGVASFEVRPSWTGTFSIIRNTLKADPIFGVGPNRFVDQWVLYKPAGVNNTRFWNVDFDSGISFFPTVVVMTGLAGAAAFGWLILAILSYGLQSLFRRSSDQTSRALTAITFIGLLYLIATGFIYTSGTVMLSLLFVLLGLFVAILTESKVAGNLEVSLIKDPKTSFISSLVFIAVILIAVTGGFLVVQKFWSVLVFQKASAQFNSANRDLNAVYATIERAVRLSKEDVYYRALVELNLLQVAELLNRPDQLPEQVAVEFKALINLAQTNADQAIKLNRNNYLNFVIKARLYGVLARQPGAYAKAVEFYQAALKLNPTNPTLLFNLAQLAASQGKDSEAKNYLEQAIALKPNYTDALFVLAQLEIASGDIDSVIKKVENALLLSPDDISLLFELGFLYYRNGNYQGTIDVMARTVSLNNNYSNARYFLGLALDKLGRSAEALIQFKEIARLNPDNAEVKNIIANLEAGNSALYEAPAPAPEKRKEAPIKETN